MSANFQPPAFDTTPKAPRPPEPQIDRAMRDLPQAMADLPNESQEWERGLHVVTRHKLSGALRGLGHGNAAIEWAIHRHAEQERLTASVGVTDAPSWECGGGWEGGGSCFLGDPESARIVATPRLWKWWRIRPGPLSQLDLPSISEAIERLYRLLEYPDVCPTWLQDAADETGNRRPELPCTSLLAISLGLHVILQRIAASESISDIEKSSLNDSQKLTLLQLHAKFLSGEFRDQRLLDELQARLECRTFLEKVLRAVKTTTVDPNSPGGAYTIWHPVAELGSLLTAAVNDASEAFAIRERGASREEQTRHAVSRTTNGPGRRSRFEGLNQAIRIAARRDGFESADLDQKLAESRELLSEVESWRAPASDARDADERLDRLNALNEKIVAVDFRLRDLTAAAQAIAPDQPELATKSERNTPQRTAATINHPNSQIEEANGPFDPDGFRYCGKSARFRRAAKQRRLVCALWQNGNLEIAQDVTSVMETVYGHDHDTEEPTFRQLCQDARAKLRPLNLTIAITSGKVQLQPLLSDAVLGSS